MNFLAHIYLSGRNPKVMVGNFIGDFVKGRNLLEQFEPDIVRGIELHRSIDEFTDRHPVVLKSKIRLRAKYRHFAPVIVDIFYDHFLARYWKNFHPRNLEEFTIASYAIIQSEWSILPAGVRQMLPYMIKQNWLLQYVELAGIERVLKGMAQRSRFDSKMDESIRELKQYYSEFRAEFEIFFPELEEHANQFLQ
jgi:acyl carrier protein phosphodiesterase